MKKFFFFMSNLQTRYHFDNGLSHAQYQVITWTNIDLLPIKPLLTTVSEIYFNTNQFQFANKQ